MLAHKVCFQGFSAPIPEGVCIVLIGANGSGKSSLLKMIGRLQEPTSGQIVYAQNQRLAYVPQVIETDKAQSGAERFQSALSQAIAQSPDVLLLDEPTNHLDRQRRQALVRYLKKYKGSLIVATHDPILAREIGQTLWHIHSQQITVYDGGYDAYRALLQQQKEALERDLRSLKLADQQCHQDLMQEQVRAAKSRAKGEKNILQRKWPTVVSMAKARRAEETSGRKREAVFEKKQLIQERLQALYQQPQIVPRFSLRAAEIPDRTILSITEGRVAYQGGELILEHINMALASRQRLGVLGSNGSGKSTLAKAITQDPTVKREGHWVLPKPSEIGYLDQHYRTLTASTTVRETIWSLVPQWTYAEVRKYLNNFLFPQTEVVETPVAHLSGGEKARLCLAQIGVRTPRLLILDELTNNLDLETRQHMVTVLQAYPGALLVISHDEYFLDELDIDDKVDVAMFK